MEQKEPQGYKGRSLSTEEIEIRERLVSFLQVFIKAMLQTGHYSSDHPMAKKSREGIYLGFRDLLGSQKEVNFLARFEGGVAKDIFIDGVTAETTSLNTVMTVNQSELFLSKFADYFVRRGLVSFSLKSEMDEDELDRFVEVMSESRAGQFTDPSQKGRKLTEELVKNRIVHVSAVFDNDVVKLGRGIPWRVEMALLRLRKDLGVVPMFKHLSPSQMTQIKREVVADIVRPIGHPNLLVDVLINSSNAVSDVQNLKDVDVEAEIVKSIRADLLWNVAEKTADKLSSKNGATIPPEATRKIKDVLRKLGERMLKVNAKDAFDTLQRLYNLGVIESGELPEELRGIVRIQMMADDFIQYPGRYISGLKSGKEAGTYRSAVEMITRIFPELIRRGELERASEAVSILTEHKLEKSPEFPEKISIAKEALEKIGSERNLVLLKNALENLPKEARTQALAIFGAFGLKAIRELLEELAATENPDIRKSIIGNIEAMGEGALPYLVEEMKRPEQPWFVLRNLLGILANVGARDEAADIQPFADHQHPKVREEAILALHKLLGPASEATLLKALDDKDQKVATRALTMLGSMRSRNPKVLQFYSRILSPETDMPDGIRMQVCISVGLLGECTFPDNSTSVDVLEKVLSTGQSGKLFGLVKSAQVLPPAVRLEAARSLGRIGTPKAMSVLKGFSKDKDPKVRETVGQILAR